MPDAGAQIVLLLWLYHAAHAILPGARVTRLCANLRASRAARAAAIHAPLLESMHGPV